jgi:hypothetical protein
MMEPMIERLLAIMDEFEAKMMANMDACIEEKRQRRPV